MEGLLHEIGQIYNNNNNNNNNNNINNNNNKMIWIDFMSWIKHMTLIQFIHCSKTQLIIMIRTINNFKYTSWYPFMKMCSSNEPIVATI